MSLQYHQTLITPFEVGALHNLIATAPDGPDREIAYRWLCHARSGLYEEWCALPPGHHLKDAYRKEVWQWDDQDLASIPKDRLVSQEEVRRIGEDLQVDDNLPGSEAVDLQGFRRPTAEEVEADG